jgi:hypothetical protein
MAGEEFNIVNVQNAKAARDKIYEEERMEMSTLSCKRH